ncbi:hypothetical protein RQP46_000811 [Phenoliferia psychrophenolica]
MSNRPTLSTLKSDGSIYISNDYTSRPEEELLYGQSQPDREGSGVVLAPWAHTSSALIGLGFALLLQGALLAVAIFLTRNPILRPTALPLFSTVTIKSFNVIVVVIGSVIAGASSYGISIGARSYLSHKLVTALFAVGQVGLVRKASVAGVVPLVLFALASSASSALVGTFTAATEHQVLDFSLRYVTFQQNQDFYNTNSNVTLRQLTLNSPQDFEAFPFRAGRWVNGNISTNETRTAVDGTESTPSSGFLPVMLPVTAFTGSVHLYNRISAPQEEKFSGISCDIIGNATDDAYKVSAPTAVASATCLLPANMTATLSPSSSSSDYVEFAVQDSTCGSTTFIYRNLTSNITGTYSCMGQDNKAYIAYFDFLPSTGTIFPLAQCSATAGYGDGSGITYRDSDVSYKMSLGDKLGRNAFHVQNIVDASPLSILALQVFWYQFFGLQSSPGLTYFSKATKRSFVKSALREWELLTIGMLNIGLAKVVNTETYHSLYENPGNRTDGKVAGTTPYYTELSSTAVWIGPRGYNRLWLAIIGGMFICLLVAFCLTARFRPVTLNPLNPVSVLLVAQNSPTTPLADGGCLGDVDQVRATADTRIRFRAVNNQVRLHLGIDIRGPAGRR